MTEADIEHDLKEAAAKAVDSAEKGGDKISATVDQVRKTVNDKASAARDWAGDRAGVTRDWALDQGDVLRDTVQTRPFISVGVSAASAFAAGLILGILLTRD